MTNAVENILAARRGLPEIILQGSRARVDRTYRLDEAVAALNHFAGGHARGKVVLVA